MRRAAVMAGAALAVAMVACGSSAPGGTATGAASLPPTTGSPRASAGPTPRAELLFAVLETHSRRGGLPQPADTVAIVGLDGHARARATFTPWSVPFIGNAATVLAPEARVAAGAAYYADGSGTVRRLAVGASPSTVTRFPLVSGQQQLSFAVSPDGARLSASVFSYPPKADNQPSCGLGCPFFQPGPYRLDIETAPSGGEMTQVRHEEYPQDSPLDHVPEVVGWDTSGPLMSVDAVMGTQQGTFSRTWFGHIVHMDGSGHPASALGGGDCEAVAQSGGAVACNTFGDQTVNVVSPTAATWLAKAAGQNPPFGVALSPDGASLALGGGEQATGVLATSGGGVRPLLKGFVPQGWLDSQTMVGIITSGDEYYGRMTVVRAGAPTSAVDLGFDGMFVGVVQQAG